MATRPGVLIPSTVLAAREGVSPQTVRRWWRAGRIDGLMIGGRLLVDVLSMRRKQEGKHD
jgi:predicted site-specific integrase-resolvase